MIYLYVDQNIATSSITERLYVRNWEQKKQPRQVSF